MEYQSTVSQVTQPDTYASALYRLLLGFNRRLLFLLNRLEPPLSVNESYILSDIASHPGLSASEAGRKMGIPKGTLSRVINVLALRGLLTTCPDRDDRRIQRLHITRSGRQLLTEDLTLRNHEMDMCVASLQPSERTELVALLHRMATAFGAPALQPEFGEDSLLVAIRRNTRVLNVQGEDCMGTGQPSSVCQVVNLLQYADSPMPLTLLANTLPYSACDLSRLLGRLARRHFLEKRSLSADRRRVALSLTSAGVTFAKELEVRAQRRLSASRVAFTELECVRLLALLRAFLTVPVVVNAPPKLQGWHFTRLEPAELCKARTFLFKSLAQQPDEYALSPWLLAPTHLICAAYHRNNLRGVLELRPDGDTLSLEHLVLQSSDQNRFVPRTLLQVALEYATTLPIIRNVSVPPCFWTRLSPEGAPWVFPPERTTLPLDVARRAFADPLVHVPSDSGR